MHGGQPALRSSHRSRISSHTASKATTIEQGNRAVTDRQMIATGAFLGMLGVILGAFGAHALESQLPPHRFALWETASRYQMYHALALIAAGIVAGRYNADLAICGW